jgi:hypothetical protein
MKSEKVFYILVAFLFLVIVAGCSPRGELKEVYVSDDPILVLNKQSHTIKGSTSYRMQVFDGKNSYWAYTNRDAFNDNSIGDTLKNATLTLIYVKEERTKQ